MHERNESDIIDVYEMYFDDIASIQLVQQGDAVHFSVYEVMSRDEESWLSLILPHEYGDDRMFASAVEAKVSH